MCNALKEEKDFYQNGRNWCRSCHNSRVNKRNKERYTTELAFREIQARASRKYQEKNKERIRKQQAFTNSIKRAEKFSAVLRNEAMGEIYNFYMQCPRGFVVDHIIPFKNNIVCGLHTLSNLQYLTIKENCSKNNRLI